MPAFPRPQAVTPPAATTGGFEVVYRAWFHDCCRWLQAMGVADGDVEDVAQEVFLVVQRKLDDEPIENLAGWIYRIARNTASDRRRRAWWRRVWSRRAEVSVHEASGAPSPLERVLSHERAERVRALLDELPPRQRAALVLFEVLGYGGDEIAALEGIPVATVWTRLHHARRRFIALVAAAGGVEELP